MKIYYYTLFFAVMMVLFNTMSFDTTTSNMATKLGIFDLENYTSFSFWIAVGSIFTVVGLAGAIVGFFTTFSPQYVIKGLFIMGIMVGFLSDLISIVFMEGVKGTWVQSVLLMIVAPLAVGYAIALVEFWNGND